ARTARTGWKERERQQRRDGQKRTRGAATSRGTRRRPAHVGGGGLPVRGGPPDCGAVGEAGPDPGAADPGWAAPVPGRGDPRAARGARRRRRRRERIVGRTFWPDPLLFRATWLLGDLGQHVAAGEDEEILAVDGDLRAAVLRVHDDVAHGDVDVDELARLVRAGARG